MILNILRGIGAAGFLLYLLMWFISADGSTTLVSTVSAANLQANATATLQMSSTSGAMTPTATPDVPLLPTVVPTSVNRVYLPLIAQYQGWTCPPGTGGCRPD